MITVRTLIRVTKNVKTPSPTDIKTPSPTGLKNDSTARGPATTEPSYPRENDNRTTMILAAGFVTSCVSVVALVLAFVYYRRHKKHKRIKLVNPLTELKFEFDAFIIYSSKDSEWVVKTLLPTLEEKHGLKCCVHYRDFTPGIPIRQNMVDSIYKCKKTVAVVSSNFFNSNYCGSELDYALHRLIVKMITA
ncbi:toll-like receptor 1 [Stylophora pistillata]|uniref:toll-like receptor 1 n=1 Tax=Stylophora pistillata TaxID=50429 RepID=UPI000C0496E5|nr:toll-like receptor 1 [Stylophora pistillata]